MKTIAEQMTLIKQQKRIGLMTHVVAGYPSLPETEKLVLMMAQNGADFVEIQIPFSDPLADGPVIMLANDLALKNGTTLNDFFKLIERLGKSVEIPLVCMGYYHTVFQYGVERFCKKAQEVGIAGLIIPDIPVDEESYEKFSFFCHKHHLANIKVISPSSTDGRILANAAVASGFVYCTARNGVTGTQTTLSTETQSYLANVKKLTNLPLAVGFGISKRADIELLVGHADVAVVGSAVIAYIQQHGTDSVAEFINELSTST